jgi:hypothetical protein
LNDFVVAAISISRNSENKEYFFHLNFLPVIFDVIDTASDFAKTNGLIILANLSLNDSVDRKNEILYCSVFSRLLPHLEKVVEYMCGSISSTACFEGSYECQQLKWMSGIFSVLLMNNLYGGELFIKSDVIPHLLKAFEVLTPISVSKQDIADIACVQHSILSCLVYLSYCKNEFPSPLIDYFIENGAILKLLGFITSYLKTYEDGVGNFSYVLLERSISVLFNISIEGALRSRKGEKNTRASELCEKAKQQLLTIYGLFLTRSASLNLEAFNCPNSSLSLNLHRQLILKYIPIIVLNFYKGEKCPDSLADLLLQLHDMIACKSPASEVDWPRWASLAWNGVIDAEGTFARLEKN